MSSPIVSSSRFRSDYLNALEYSAEHGGTWAANRLEAGVMSACDLLAVFPLMYQVSEKPGLARRRIRECNFGTWKILYRVEGGDVMLLRLLHQSQNTETKV